jgi:hypothetical protein
VLDVETSESKEVSLAVIVPRYGIEGRVQLDIDVNDSELARFPDEHKVTCSNGGRQVSIQVK